jgi:hypothetical protein
VRHLLSKIVAGGLSAGVILLWWPLVFPSDTVESWLVRGVLWTLCFELMLHSFAPLEEALWRSRAARKVAAQAQAATARIGTASPEKRHWGRMAIAGFALTVPLTLLATAPAHRLSPKPAAASVKHVTQVKRVVRVERRTVTVPRAARPAAGRPATPQAAGTTTGAGGRARAQYRRGRAATRTSAPRRTAAGNTGSNGPGRRSGSSGSTAPAPGDSNGSTPPTGSSMGSGERAATTTLGQPKRRAAL